MSYQWLSFVLFPVFFIYTLKITLKFKSLRYFKQRLGFSYSALDHSPIWIHCASVGEINTFSALLERLIERLPEQIFLITSNTVTGAKILKKHHLKNTHHSFLPIENKHAIQRFLQHYQPKLVLIMETEIWPLLYQAVNDKNIPLDIINARLSDKTMNTHPWIKKQYKRALGHVDHVYTRSEQDSLLFKNLGCAENKIQLIGNLKFSTRQNNKETNIQHFTERSFVLAASTHDDEESQLAKIWKTCELTDHLLVIVPRHPERGESIKQKILNLDLTVALRSKKQNIDAHTNVYIADTLGELPGFMQQSKIVFMGGSLIPHGGQNLLEAARLNKAIIVGPHMDNFSSELNLFNQHNACIQVKNSTELGHCVRDLLLDDQARKQLELSAGQLMKKQADVSQQYLLALQTAHPAIFS